MSDEKYLAEIIVRQVRGFESGISNLFSHRGTKCENNRTYRTPLFEINLLNCVHIMRFVLQYSLAKNQGKTFLKNFVLELQFYVKHKVKGTPT